MCACVRMRAIRLDGCAAKSGKGRKLLLCGKLEKVEAISERRGSEGEAAIKSRIVVSIVKIILKGKCLLVTRWLACRDKQAVILNVSQTKVTCLARFTLQSFILPLFI